MPAPASPSTGAVEARSYTSNTAKLLKHLPMLHEMQQSGKVRPVMIHLAPLNGCQISCEYCCYGSRSLKQQLTWEQVTYALDSFAALGTRGLESTGGGESTLWKKLGDAFAYAYDLGYRIGLITNGLDFKNVLGRFPLLEWMRVSFHGFNFDKQNVIDRNIKLARDDNPDMTISGVYIWTTGSDKIYPKVARFAEENRIPTRVTPDLTAGPAAIDAMMQHVGQAVADNPSSFTFLSDFNVKTTRQHDRCYMHAIKPFIFPDGWVYSCPSIGLTPESSKNVLDEFRICRIEEIAEYYSKPVQQLPRSCIFCKYAAGNELIDDILRPTEHNDFA